MSASRKEQRKEVLEKSAHQRVCHSKGNCESRFRFIELQARGQRSLLASFATLSVPLSFPFLSSHTRLPLFSIPDIGFSTCLIEKNGEARLLSHFLSWNPMLLVFFDFLLRISLFLLHPLHVSSFPSPASPAPFSFLSPTARSLCARLGDTGDHLSSRAGTHEHRVRCQRSRRRDTHSLSVCVCKIA